METQLITKKRLDYRPSDYLIPTVELSFNLEKTTTKIKSHLRINRNGDHDRPLILDGEQQVLVDLRVNGNAYSHYELTDKQLIIKDLPESCFITVYTEIEPSKNTSLEGLYYTSNAYCTQCEAEGFRKITYFLDRPDVLSEYTVTIYADKSAFPHLLSNGNKVDSGEVEGGIHWVKWHDPFNKPCYLFALVAGNFDLLTDQFTTKSGREVSLELYVDQGKKHKGFHALSSLKKSMAWDENTFGLEYDLDVYMIVAVDFFNMGAMENKGLNVFNSKFVLADNASATDEDFFNIESVIAHEYFHNWTGNRVTCRDWFQLSLKEGLTVFRDQQFSADMSSAVVNRIKNVKVIREHQFAEDASAMSHPIRPDEVIEMNNFYTVTVYDKGAEVIRMMHSLLGATGFRKGMDLYFTRHDGQAVTCDDFVDAMQSANQYDLSLFKRWYSQSGTPEVTVSEEHTDDTYTLTLSQMTRPTADQKEKLTLLIPLKISYRDDNGDWRTEDLVLDDSTLTMTKEAVKQRPILSLLDGFSAPVKVHRQQTFTDLLMIAQECPDGFSQWDACQALYSRYIHNQTLDVPAPKEVSLQDIHTLIASVIERCDDPAVLSEMLTLPSLETLGQQVEVYRVLALKDVVDALKTSIAIQHHDALLACYSRHEINEQFKYTIDQCAKRKVRNMCLHYLAKTNDSKNIVTEHYASANNMTDTLGALSAAQDAQLSCFTELMTDFEQKWQHDNLVMDKWFALQASYQGDDILSRIDLLFGHQQFNINNPNRVRSVLGTFTFYNTSGFHAQDGSGYRYVADHLITLDKINPQVAARLCTPLTQWHKFESYRGELMRTQLLRIADNKELSKDLFEKVSKSLSYQS